MLLLFHPVLSCMLTACPPSRIEQVGREIWRRCATSVTLHQNFVDQETFAYDAIETAFPNDCTYEES